MKREVRQRPKPKYKHLSHEFTIYLAPRRLERITKGTKPVNVCTIGDLEDHCPTWDKYDILKGRSQETSKTTPNLKHPLSCVSFSFSCPSPRQQFLRPYDLLPLDLAFVSVSLPLLVQLLPRVRYMLLLALRVSLQ